MRWGVGCGVRFLDTVFSEPEVQGLRVQNGFKKPLGGNPTPYESPQPPTHHAQLAQTVELALQLLLLLLRLFTENQGEKQLL
jgi:hypothetical protein